MAQCWYCGVPSPFRGRAPRTEECPACKRDVHCCKGCHHYDRTLNNECRETQADWVSEKERRNFCDYFLVSERPVAKKPGKDNLDAKWSKLFKKP